MIDYHPGWLDQASREKLMNLAPAWPFEQTEVVVWEKRHPVPRLTCFFSDTETGYRYSNQETPSNPYPPAVLAVKTQIETTVLPTGTLLQHCLANWYGSGADCVGWHRDSESIFGPNPVIASISCGATRRFKMRNRETGEKLVFELASGDLLIFTDEHVRTWQHCVPKTAKPTGARLNLTFRSGR